MTDNDCVFCSIINNSEPAQIVQETDDLIVIQDILPKAPVHMLVIPKQHIASVVDLQSHDANLVGNMIILAKDVAESRGIRDSGYKLIFNVGKHGNQIIKHLHLHLLGGKQLLD